MEQSPNSSQQTSAPKVSPKRPQFETAMENLAFKSKDGVLPGMVPLQDGVPFASRVVVRKKQPVYENSHAEADPMTTPMSGPVVPRPAGGTPTPVPAKPLRAGAPRAADGGAELSDEDKSIQRNEESLEKLKRAISKQLSLEAVPPTHSPSSVVASPASLIPPLPSLTPSPPFRSSPPHFPSCQASPHPHPNTPHSSHPNVTNSPVSTSGKHLSTPVNVPMLLGRYLGTVAVCSSLKGLTNNTKLTLAGMCRDIIAGSRSYVICDGIDVGEREEEDLNAQVVIYLGLDNVQVVIPSPGGADGRTVALHRLSKVGLVHGFTDGSHTVVYVGHNECTATRAAVAVVLENEDAKKKLVDHVLSVYKSRTLSK